MTKANAHQPRRQPRVDGVNRQQIAKELLRRCADGDDEALAELHDLFAPALLSTAKGIVRNAEEAEEVVQEVFLYAWQRAESYDPRRGAVSTWLGQMVRSRAIDRLRRAAVVARTRAQMARERPTSVEQVAERRISLHQWRRRLRRELRTLPAPQRQTLLLAYYGDLTQREIAKQVQIPLGTVKTRTHLALRKLRAASDLRFAAVEEGWQRAAT